MGPVANSIRINPDTLDFDLPENLIAQHALPERDQARLLFLDRSTQKINHHIFADLPNILTPHDVLVINRTRVNHAKFFGKKETGGKVEIIFIGPLESSQWRALVRPFVKPNSKILLDVGEELMVEGHTDNGENIVSCPGFNPDELMPKKGMIPLPPYIKREKEHQKNVQDESDYQTVYATESGSIAAPTAGLHFTEKLLQTLKNKGVEIVEVVHHVGWGTFKPISTSVNEHQMMPESYKISDSSYAQLRKAKETGKRIITVGTTSTRAIESLDQGRESETNLYIYPGYKFKWITGLITNLHVPRSTPIALTGAFCGLDLLEKAYSRAIQQKYRFYSYGDGMLIL